MEVLVELHTVAPVGILLELLGSAVDRPPAVLVLEEDACESARNLLGNLNKGSSAGLNRRALHRELIAVIALILHQGPDDQEVDRIQIGPRQLSLPPNMPVSDSAGRYEDAVYPARRSE